MAWENGSYSYRCRYLILLLQSNYEQLDFFGLSVYKQDISNILLGRASVFQWVRIDVDMMFF